MNNEEIFEEVTNDVIKAIGNIKYEDIDKELLRIELLQNIARFLQNSELYEDNKKILNERAKNGLIRKHK